MRIFRKIPYFCLGGGLYTCLELLWRGRSHVSMFLLGGGCFLMLGRLRRLSLPMFAKMCLGATFITLGELLTGVLVNRDHRIWDYSNQPLNLMGQICTGFSLLWVALSWLGMGIYGAIEKRFSSAG